jgi:long-chain fatty acid transport protein
MKRIVSTAFAAGLTCSSAASWAGGLARPNGWGPQNTSLGGAGTAMVDDPTAVFINPAALAFADAQVMLGGEYIVAPRTYTPIDAAGVRGDDQSTTPKAAVPLVGAIGRFWHGDQPSRFTLGVLALNTFGGKLSYAKMAVPAINATQDALLEFVVGTSFEISDKLSVGASLRVGLGLFSSDVTDLPITAKVEANGLGVGMTFGGMFRPSKRVKLAAVWRSPLTVRTSGDSVIQFPSGESSQLAEHVQRWPQQAAVSAALAITPALTLAVQADWSEWSRVQQLSVELPKNPPLNQVYNVAWNDSYAVHVGGEFRVNPTAKVRAGGWYDTNAVPDRTIERLYLDNNKIGLSLGTGLRFGAWGVDVAADVGLPNKRTIADNRAANASWPDMQNRAPGEHSGSIYTGELTVRRMF